ncbi:MAG: hypothetical protein WD597_06470 [Balneolaceae bacterium]
MAQGRVLGGVLVLVGNLVLPAIIIGIATVVGINSSKEGFSEANKKASASTELDYVANLELYDIEAKKIDTYSGQTTGINFKLKNNGDSTLSKVRVLFYFLNNEGNVIFEEDFLPVSESIWDDSKPLKPNYIWQNDQNKYFTIDNVPDEWKAGSVTAEITEISFQ